MRFIKLGVISVVFFAVIVTAISLLLPSSVTVSRAIDIIAPYDSLYREVYNMSNWKAWYATNGAVAPVAGDKVIKIGDTQVERVFADSNTVKAIWQTNSNTPLSGEFNFIRQPNTMVTTVQWRFTHKVSWLPWEKFALIIFDKTLSPTMQESLDNLKRIASEVK